MDGTDSATSGMMRPRHTQSAPQGQRTRRNADALRQCAVPVPRGTGPHPSVPHAVAGTAFRPTKFTLTLDKLTL